MQFEISQLANSDELATAYTILKELRLDLTLEIFSEIYSQAHAADSYKLYGGFADGLCVAVIGFRILFDYVHGKHLYIDDLVTSAKSRSCGIGARMLAFAEVQARELNCQGLRLATGIANADAKRFYEREGWQFRSVVYKKILKRS